MPNPDKVATVAELTESFRESNAAVLTEYRGLSVSQLTELRASIGEHASYAVVKNTLTKIAAKEAGITAFDGQLTGPSALAFITGDPVEAAKGLRDFARAHPALVIKAAVLDGRPLSPAEVSQLADLESREVLLSKLAGALKASLSGAAALFQAPLAQAARAVEALRQKVEAGDAAPADDAASEAAAPEAAASGDAAPEAPAPAAPAPEAAAPEAPAGNDGPA